MPTSVEVLKKAVTEVQAEMGSLTKELQAARTDALRERTECAAQVRRNEVLRKENEAQKRKVEALEREKNEQAEAIANHRRTLAGAPSFAVIQSPVGLLQYRHWREGEVAVSLGEVSAEDVAARAPTWFNDGICEGCRNQPTGMHLCQGIAVKIAGMVTKEVCRCRENECPGKG